MISEQHDCCKHSQTGTIGVVSYRALNDEKATRCIRSVAVFFLPIESKDFAEL
jgi:hypothetical protein